MLCLENYGKCDGLKAGTCQYTHLPQDKGPGKGKGKDKGGKGLGQGGKSTGKSKTGSGSRENSRERTKVVTDLALVCRAHLAGKCTKGNQCKYHHNEPCRFHAAGTCKAGDKCPFPHVGLAAQAALQEDAPAPKAKPKKAKAKAGSSVPGQEGATES